MKQTNHYQTRDVICYGKKQNQELLRFLWSQGYHFTDGQPIKPDNLRYTGSITDEEDAIIKTACYAIDATLKMVAFHDSMSLLNLYQSGRGLIGLDEYFNRIKENEKQRGVDT